MKMAVRRPGSPTSGHETPRRPGLSARKHHFRRWQFWICCCTHRRCVFRVPRESAWFVWRGATT